MSSVTASSLSDQYTLDTSTTVSHAKELGQEEFLELMTAQLENQDPMKPMDNGEFLGQMAQFSTVTGIEEMQKSLDNLAATYANGQTLQSTQLVGQEVLIESNAMELSDTGVTGGSFELDSTSEDVLVNIADANGTVVRQISLGSHDAGRHPFSWDGMNDRGERMPPGTYQAEVTARQGDEFNAASVLTTRIVDSVEFGGNGQTSLNTKQGDVLSLADIRQIRSRSEAGDTEQ